MNRYLENTLIEQASVNSKTFLGQLYNYILPQYTLYLGPYSVFIMNNCSIHQNKVFLSYFYFGYTVLLIYVAYTIYIEYYFDIFLLILWN